MERSILIPRGPCSMASHMLVLPLNAAVPASSSNLCFSLPSPDYVKADVPSLCSRHPVFLFLSLFNFTLGSLLLSVHEMFWWLCEICWHNCHEKTESLIGRSVDGPPHVGSWTHARRLQHNLTQRSNRCPGTWGNGVMSFIIMFLHCWTLMYCLFSAQTKSFLLHVQL